MNAEKQHKESSSNVVQSKPGGKLNFVDNRYSTIFQSKVINDIYYSKYKPPYVSDQIIQKKISLEGVGPVKKNDFPVIFDWFKTVYVEFAPIVKYIIKLMCEDSQERTYKEEDGHHMFYSGIIDFLYDNTIQQSKLGEGPDGQQSNKNTLERMLRSSIHNLEDGEKFLIHLMNNGMLKEIGMAYTADNFLKAIYMGKAADVNEQTNAAFSITDIDDFYKMQKQNPDIIVTHNHPKGYPLSLGDVGNAAADNYKEIRAVGKLGVFSMSRKGTDWGKIVNNLAPTKRTDRRTYAMFSAFRVYNDEIALKKIFNSKVDQWSMINKVPDKIVLKIKGYSSYFLNHFAALKSVEKFPDLIEYRSSCDLNEMFEKVGTFPDIESTPLLRL